MDLKPFSLGLSVDSHHNPDAEFLDRWIRIVILGGGMYSTKSHVPSSLNIPHVVRYNYHWLCAGLVSPAQAVRRSSLSTLRPGRDIDQMVQAVRAVWPAGEHVGVMACLLYEHEEAVFGLQQSGRLYRW